MWVGYDKKRGADWRMGGGRTGAVGMRSSHGEHRTAQMHAHIVKYANLETQMNRHKQMEAPIEAHGLADQEEHEQQEWNRFECQQTGYTIQLMHRSGGHTYTQAATIPAGHGRGESGARLACPLVHCSQAATGSAAQAEGILPAPPSLVGSPYLPVYLPTSLPPSIITSSLPVSLPHSLPPALCSLASAVRCNMQRGVPASDSHRPTASGWTPRLGAPAAGAGTGPSFPQLQGASKRLRLPSS